MRHFSPHIIIYTIVENKDKYKSTKFQDIHSYQIELAKEVIAGNGAPFNFIPFTKKERELFEKYMDSGSYILDFFDSNEQHILEEYLSLSKTQSADRQTEWIQEQIQKHKEKKEEKRNREVTDYGYDLPSSYEYVNENEPETSSASSFRFFSDDFATYILNHWDREFDVVHFLFPIVSVIMLFIFVPISRFAELDGVRVTTGAWLIYDLLFFVLWIIPFDIIVFIFKKLSVLYVKSHYLEFEEETDEEIEQDIADDPEDHNDNIPYAEESDFEDDTIYTEERKPIPKIIPKKKKAPFNVEAFAKECNAYVVKQERQEEQENLQH